MHGMKLDLTGKSGQELRISKSGEKIPVGWRDPDEAFAVAISAGRLSGDPRSELYAGNFMFMGPDTAGRDSFKHIITRRYLVSE